MGSSLSLHKMEQESISSCDIEALFCDSLPPNLCCQKLDLPFSFPCVTAVKGNWKLWQCCHTIQNSILHNKASEAKALQNTVTLILLSPSLWSLDYDNLNGHFHYSNPHNTEILEILIRLLCDKSGNCKWVTEMIV